MAYNGQSQKPTASVNTGIDGEVLQLTVGGAAINAGENLATATTDNAKAS